MNPQEILEHIFLIRGTLYSYPSGSEEINWTDYILQVYIEKQLLSQTSKIPILVWLLYSFGNLDHFDTDLSGPQFLINSKNITW